MFLKAVVLALSAVFCTAILNAPNIFRPCKLNNIACIQNDLRSRSGCLPPRGFAPPVYSIPRAHFDTPAFNASYDDNNLVIRGLDRCFVSEYYINQRTNVRLLALDCPWLTFESSRVMYQHYPRREDVILRYNISGSYPLVTVTTALDPGLCGAYPSCHVHALPVFNISPLDRLTENRLTRDLAGLGIYEQETFSARSQFLARVIINNLLCNFGCY